MVRYRYVARTRRGEKVRGQLFALDRTDIQRRLWKEDLVLVELEAQLVAKRRRGALPRRMPIEEQVLFARQLATLVPQGLPILESVAVLGEGAAHPATKDVCRFLEHQIAQGESLSASMAACGRVFSPLAISMIRAGEASGRLDQTLASLADTLEESQAQRREVLAALVYPALSLFLVLSISAFLLLAVVPSFREVFQDLGSELPALTAALLAVSAWLRSHVLWIAWGVLAAAGLSIPCAASSAARQIFERVSLCLPLWGDLRKRLAIARFARTLSTLLRAGVPILSTVDLVADTAGLHKLARTVRECRSSLLQGTPLSVPLGASRLFPGMVVSMIAIGERTGSIEPQLEKIAEFYEAQVRAAVRSLSALLQPLLVAFLGLFVGTILMAIFLALLKLIGEIGAGR